jgi:hypothetical protein
MYSAITVALARLEKAQRNKAFSKMMPLFSADRSLCSHKFVRLADDGAYGPAKAMPSAPPPGKETNWVDAVDPNGVPMDCAIAAAFPNVNTSDQL